MIVRTLTHAASELTARVGGIIGEATNTNAELLAFIRSAGVTVVVVMFIWMVHKKSWATGAIVAAVLVGMAVLWAINGGLEYGVNLWREQFG